MNELAPVNPTLTRVKLFGGYVQLVDQGVDVFTWAKHVAAYVRMCSNVAKGQEQYTSATQDHTLQVIGSVDDLRSMCIKNMPVIVYCLIKMFGVQFFQTQKYVDTTIDHLCEFTEVERNKFREAFCRMLHHACQWMTKDPQRSYGEFGTWYDAVNGIWRTCEYYPSMYERKILIGDYVKEIERCSLALEEQNNTNTSKA